MVITINYNAENRNMLPFYRFMKECPMSVIKNNLVLTVYKPDLCSTISELEESIVAAKDQRKKVTPKDIALWREIRDGPGDFKRSEQLIKEGANVNSITRLTLLHHAYNSETADFLIKHGASVDAHNLTGLICLDDDYYSHLNTPLRRVVNLCNGVIATLLFYNADPSIPDHDGNTPLMFLVKTYSPDPQSRKQIALLLEYVYDFSYVNEAGSSLLTLAMISEYHRCIVDDIIRRGGNFSTLSGDLRVLTWCIDQRDSEEFKWFWNVFNYKNTWFFKQPILYYLLLEDNYELFDFVIQSSKLVDVLDVWFGDHDYKEGTILHSLECQEAEFTLIDILNATARNYNLERAETAIYILISFGYEPREQEVLEIYKVFGNGELFKLCLNFDVLEPSSLYSFSSLIPKILLNPNRSGQEIVNQCLINESDLRRESLMFTFTMSHFYDHRTNEFLKDLYNTYQEMAASPRRVPSLLELSRNQALYGIWKMYKIKKRSHFWNVMKNIPVPPLIEGLIQFRFPVDGQIQ